MKKGEKENESLLCIYQIDDNKEPVLTNKEPVLTKSLKLNVPIKDVQSVRSIIAIDDGAYIVEFIGDNDFSRLFLVTSNSALEIIGGRRYFHKDKYGYLYCLDGASKKILKLTNVNGRPVAFYSYESNSNILGLIGIDRQNDKLYILASNGEMCFVKTLSTDCFTSK